MLRNAELILGLLQALRFLRSRKSPDVDCNTKTNKVLILFRGDISAEVDTDLRQSSSCPSGHRGSHGVSNDPSDISELFLATGSIIY